MRKFRNYCRLLEISDDIIEMTIEKRKEFLQKVTDEMSKDQWSENVQKSFIVKMLES